ncbi:MAG TPA: hypothetical protein OIM03_02125 [Veillonellaceae bacterium]|uniref:hypothetical protein n=2 Tax=Dialister hominis TaxID=2582419 RepID=UPI0035229EB4|nr:hypothetical protein [Veillonellaceae bacterium]
MLAAMPGERHGRDGGFNMGWRRIAGRIAKVGARIKGEPEPKYQKIRYYEEEAGIFNDRELIDMYKISEQTYQRTQHEEDKWCAYGYKNELKKRGLTD